MEAHIHAAIRAKAEDMPEVMTDSMRSSSGEMRTWFVHEPCDDESTIHGENEGFMACRHTEDGFVLQCDGCGYEVDYD